MIVPIYAAILGLIFVVLSIRTLLLRRAKGIAIGTGEDAQLTRAMRVHSNFAEYVPIAIILIYFLEVQTEALLWVHILGISLILGRISHAYGVSQLNENYQYRVFGMALTLGTLISASIRIIMSYLYST